MTKPMLHVEEQPQHRNIQRADIAPSNGQAWLTYPMLQVEIYDTSSKSRTLVR
jgi:hypothetical protein